MKDSFSKDIPRRKTRQKKRQPEFFQRGASKIDQKPAYANRNVRFGRIDGLLLDRSLSKLAVIQSYGIFGELHS
jgi:hypothetical protein